MVKEDLISKKEYVKSRKGRLFIKNLPFDIDVEKLEKVFRRCGEVESINFPKKKEKDGKEVFKGFGFVQYKHKNMALKAVNTMNNRLVGGRRVEVTLAEPKKTYEKTKEVAKTPEAAKSNPETKVKKEAGEIKAGEVSTESKTENGEVLKKKRKRSKKKKNKVQIQTVQDAFTQKESESEPNNQEYRKPLNDPAKTIFVQNVNYTSTEDNLYNFFKRFGPVVYAKICKSNGVSKGTAFVMFSRKEDCDAVIDSASKANTDLNPFEFEGKNLKIFRAYDKSDQSQIPTKKEDKRNREYLLFGLYKHFNGDLSDTDKEKREFLMNSKKDNFKNNPNLFTSKTRLTLRNFSKKITDQELKDLMINAAKSWTENLPSEKRKEFSKGKFIKQVKILKDPQQNEKSKGTAFAEVATEELAKALIEKLSNTMTPKGEDKGLIIDFALEDSRKVYKRTMRQNKVKHDNNVKKKERKQELNLQKQKEAENQHLNLIEKNEGATIDKIEDKSKLCEMYFKNPARGKKQRIRNRLAYLLNKSQDEVSKFLQGEKAKFVSFQTETVSTLDNSEYKTKEIDTKNSNLNKKAKKERKDDKKKEKLLNKKRKKEPKYDEDDDDEMEGGMNSYFQEIEKKLKSGSTIS